MKKSVLILFTILFVPCIVMAQPRDRRADLEVRCLRNAAVSPSGELWIVTRCGGVFHADSIGATWRTSEINAEGMYKSSFDGPTLDRVAPFGNHTAVLAGFIPDEGVHKYNFALRTVTDGQQWDTVHFAPSGTHWIDGFCYHADGRLWMGSNSGLIAFSADSGRTFTRVGDTALHLNADDLYMLTADSGWLADHSNRLFSTSDNWRTCHRYATPRDQGLYAGKAGYFGRIRPWQGHLLAIEAGRSYIAPKSDSLRWRATRWPLRDFEVDTLSHALWAVTDSGQLLYCKSLDEVQVVRSGLAAGDGRIFGIHAGRVYLLTDLGIVRVAPDGRADTCGFYTTERTIEEGFDSLIAQYGGWASDDMLPTVAHGGRLWRSDGSSIYLQDALGWYRIAKPLGVQTLLPDPDRTDRVVFLSADRRNYSVDTLGLIEPYTYRQPLAPFLASGLQSVEIKTYEGGCFHYYEHVVGYTREGNRLRESMNTVDSNRWVTRFFPADSLEHALMQLGTCYSRFPSPRDFGLEDGDVNLEKVYLSKYGGCTSRSGYRITFVNHRGDTLTARGSSDINCGAYFPWMLPMTFTGDSAAFVTYQPLLWQALRPMMPEGMMHRSFLSNSTLVSLRPGDLLFFSEDGGMGSAIKASTGHYTHVAIVESVGDTVWVIDATPDQGVARRPLKYRRGFAPDVYRLKAQVDMEPVLSRARSFIGQPYDQAFLPDNGALYCSELVYESFLDATGGHLFEAHPMNWRDAKGKMPRYWKKHFRKLKMPVPEGVPGTNPTDLARSPLLKRL